MAIHTKGHRKLIIQSDSSYVVDCCNRIQEAQKVQRMQWIHQLLVDDIKDLLQQLEDWQLGKVFSESNVVADCLAIYGSDVLMQHKLGNSDLSSNIDEALVFWGMAPF